MPTYITYDLILDSYVHENGGQVCFYHTVFEVQAITKAS